MSCLRWVTVIVTISLPMSGTLGASAAADQAPVHLEEHVVVQAEPLDRVEISFVVHDRAGKPVTGLGKDDFRLKVNGVETALGAVEAARQARERPLSIAFLVDVSHSMGGIERERFLSGARALLARLRSIDEMMLVTFSDVPRVQCDFTSDTAVLAAALETVPRPRGGTNLWRPLEEAMDRLSARAGHGVIVLYSDGQVPTAATSLTAEPDSTDVLERTHRRSVPLYWIVPHSQAAQAVVRSDALGRLVTQSGGRWILETRGIEAALDEVGQELDGRYDASFNVDTAKRARRTYEIDLKARSSALTVRAPLLVAGSLPALEHLEQMLSGERREERIAAAAQLRGYGYAAAFSPLLRSYGREEDPDVREAVLDALLAVAREEWNAIGGGADASDRRRRIERQLRSLDDPRASGLLAELGTSAPRQGHGPAD